VTLTYNLATMLVSVLLPNILAHWFKCEPDGGHVLGAERVLLLAAGGWMERLTAFTVDTRAHRHTDTQTCR
jgi:hypothetical protein